MTAIVGVLCSDGVVLGADSSTTLSAGQIKTIEQQTEKIEIISGKVIVAGTGQVGLGQRFNAVVKKAWDEKAFQGPPTDVGKQLSKRAQNDFAETQVKMGLYGALVAFPCGHKPQLCEFAVSDMQPELKSGALWYCSMGSSQLITDPFLALMREIFWTTGPPSIRDATLAVTWALDHAIAVNPGGVNGPARIAVLESGAKGQYDARMVTDDELLEHRQWIAEAKKRLCEFRKELTAVESAPDVPKP